jgi:hypothetical protein
MSERRYPLEPEKAGEDYHTKPRLFWAHWYVATQTEPERYTASVREQVGQRFKALPNSVLEEDPELLEKVVTVLEAKNQQSAVCRQEVAALQ